MCLRWQCAIYSALRLPWHTPPIAIVGGDVFGWLKRRRETVPAAASADAAPTRMKDVFESPQAVVDWLEEFVIRGMPWRNDASLLPDEETRRDLEITAVQCDRLMKEWSVLRIAGMCWLIREVCGEPFYQEVLRGIAARLAASFGLPAEADSELGQAIDDYVAAAMAHEESRIQMHYMQRTYHDSRLYLRMLASGVGALAVGPIVNAYEAMRETYMKATTGFGWESAGSLLEAWEAVTAKPASKGSDGS